MLLCYVKAYRAIRRAIPSRHHRGFRINSILIRQPICLQNIEDFKISKNVYVVIVTSDFTIFYLCGDKNFFIFFFQTRTETFGQYIMQTRFLFFSNVSTTISCKFEQITILQELLKSKRKGIKDRKHNRTPRKRFCMTIKYT